MKDNPKTKVVRSAKRAVYDIETIYRILDDNIIAHVGFVHDGIPVVIPTMYGRQGKCLYIHGSHISRMIKALEKGVDICITVTKLNALVLAKSAYNHSLNYESVMVFGKAHLVDLDHKISALKCISDHMLKNRWEESRFPTENELNTTTVLAINIEEYSAKIRTGFPDDHKQDLSLDIWSGILPIETRYANPMADDYSKTMEIPPSIKWL